jgi:Icc protein
MAKISRHPKSGKVIRAVQITDLHLFAGSEGSLVGLNTEESLEAVKEEVRAHDLPADLILATGDLVHDGTHAAYQRSFSHLASFGLPVYCLPGNHDELLTLEESASRDSINYAEHCHYGNWHFIFLDSTIPDNDGAHLTQETLQILETHLQSSPDAHTLVCLHHQPVKMGSQWLDTMAVDNPDEFFSIIDRYPQVRGIVWGHVHQEYDGMYKNIHMMSSPSTCIQFLPKSKEFAIDSAAPGYRWLELHPDGRIETGVKRIASIPGSVDMACNGY